jgi:large conductance mechanosensitive channel
MKCRTNKFAEFFDPINTNINPIDALRSDIKKSSIKTILFDYLEYFCYLFLIFFSKKSEGCFMGMMKEFKEFAMRGNVLDMAIGIIIGGAFGKIVSSFVNDVIMPPIGIMLGGVNFNELKIIIQEAVTDPKGEIITQQVAINYGTFIQFIIDFLIIAFVIFFVIKGVNRFKRKEETAPPAPPEPSKEELLLTEIRDLLKK